MQTYLRSVLLALIVLPASVFLFSGAAAKRAIGKPVTLELQRQYSDKECTSGQISLEGKFIAYTLEVPWQGNIPLISSIPPGHYHGFIRTTVKDHWRVELTDVVFTENSIRAESAKISSAC